MSNRLETIDLLELVDRYNYLIQEYAKLSIELATKMEKFGKYKNELEIITAEFIKRGYNHKDPDHLVKMVEEEIKKREQNKDVVP